jgi:hypothetical protein
MSKMKMEEFGGAVSDASASFACHDGLPPELL